jgi:hypothetical protein
VSGQVSSKEAAYSQAERAIIDYLKGDLRGSLSLIWRLVVENLSLARRVMDKHGESAAAEAIIADMSEASGLCCIASNILDNKTLSSLVNTDAGHYWELLSGIMSDLIELRGILIKALPAYKEVDDRAMELSPMIREKIEELLRGIISELSVSLARREDVLY